MQILCRGTWTCLCIEITSKYTFQLVIRICNMRATELVPASIRLLQSLPIIHTNTSEDIITNYSILLLVYQYKDF